jgi:hypothetical protein
MRVEPTDRNAVQCPCCDFYTLSEVGGWEICPICYWEDDGFRKAEIDVPSGANHGLTLREARANFNVLGACCRLMLGKVLAVGDRGAYRQGTNSIDT